MAEYNIQHVQSGQYITASTINNIIDAVSENGYSSDGNYQKTSNGVVIKDDIFLKYPDFHLEDGAWQVDPITLKIHNAWLTLGEKTYGACLTLDKEGTTAPDDNETIDLYHLIDFGTETLESGEYQGDYYIRVSNSLINTPEDVQTQEDDQDAKEIFDNLYTDNQDEENKLFHYYEIQVVKDTVKNGGTSSLDDDHSINPDDCIYFKFFTIYGPRDGEVDDDGNPAKTIPPFNIKYYARAFGGGLSTGESLKPWKLRWMPQSDEDQSIGEWQIYMPMGCATINGKDFYFPKNSQGKDKNNDLTYQWYKIEDPSDTDANITVIGNKVYKEWVVYVHFRDYPMMYASTSQDDQFFGGAVDSIIAGSLLQCDWEDDDGHPHSLRTTQQSKFDSYNHVFDNEGAFKIVYQCNGDRKDEESYQVFLTNQFINFGIRTQAWVEDDTDISDMENVVLDIDHSTEDVQISIIDTWEENTIDHTYIRMLKLKNKSIQIDNRNQARKEWPFYAN